MGIGLSDWRLARAVSRTGQIGTVSGTAIWLMMTRRLQDGDPGGHVRRALEHFPVPKVAEKILRRYYIEGGRDPSRPYRTAPMLAAPLKSTVAALLVAASFVEVWLAKDGHEGVVAVNYLEKIQLAHLPSLYGAMLAGVDYVIMGAGIPHQVPAALDLLAQHEPATYRINVVGDAAGVVLEERFDPASLGAPAALPPLRRPYFLPIISSHVLAAMLLKRSSGRVDGFVVEGPTAGGHNAPPRGRRKAGEGETLAYGPEDDADFEQMRQMGLPFWIAGSCAQPGSLERAIALGAHGIQAGSIFALSRDSNLRPDLRERAIDRALVGALDISTNFNGSPSGFPFKEASVERTLTDDAVYDARTRICDLGVLRTAYRRDDGQVGYRCAAEPVDQFVAKGGDEAQAAGKRCLCNALTATVGHAQVRIEKETGQQSVEPPLLTLGDDLGFLHRLANPRDYTASEAVELLLEEVAVAEVI